MYFVLGAVIVGCAICYWWPYDITAARPKVTSTKPLPVIETIEDNTTGINAEWRRVRVFGHTYIVRTTMMGSGTVTMVHDPDCEKEDEKEK